MSIQSKMSLGEIKASVIIITNKTLTGRPWERMNDRLSKKEKIQSWKMFFFSFSEDIFWEIEFEINYGVSVFKVWYLLLDTLTSEWSIFCNPADESYSVEDSVEFMNEHVFISLLHCLWYLCKEEFKILSWI